MYIEYASSFQLIDELKHRVADGGLQPGDAMWLAGELCSAAIDAQRVRS